MKHNKTVLIYLVLFAFMLSGFSALVYQVVWQRVLYYVFGVDMESVTLIITIFMVGLGVGAFLGGRLADGYRSYCLLLFVVSEMMIAAFGFFSIELIYFVGQGGLAALRIFLLLILPTIMMGMTLPLMTVFLTEKVGHVGRSIGGLYFANTLGAAMACGLTGFILFKFYGLDQALIGAVVCNLAVALSALMLHWREYEA